MKIRAIAWLAIAVSLTGCGTLDRLSEVGRDPTMTPTADPTKDPKWRPLSMPMPGAQAAPNEANSLWRSGSRAFFKDQRAAQVGDIVTVLVNMNDAANLKNVTSAARTSSETGGIPNFFGLEAILPKAINPATLVSASSANNNTGTGQIQRTEAVTLRLAGVVTQVLPNGNLVVAASQEFLVNSELRELRVTGVIRPQDIASDNTVLHDRMAEARIAYGGKGQLTDLQRARWGQQMLDILAPFLNHRLERTRALIISFYPSGISKDRPDPRTGASLVSY
jgi:flagellar L-ring protein FlgH